MYMMGSGPFCFPLVLCLSLLAKQQDCSVRKAGSTPCLIANKDALVIRRDPVYLGNE